MLVDASADLSLLSWRTKYGYSILLTTSLAKEERVGEDLEKGTGRACLPMLLSYLLALYTSHGEWTEP